MGRRGPSLGFLLAFRQLEGGNRLNDAASPTGPGLLCYHGDSHQGTQLSHPSGSHPLGLRRPTLPPCGQMYDDIDSQTLGDSVIEIGETEAQRHRRNWPEVPQGIQKELEWNSGLLSLAQHQIFFVEANPGGN